MSSLLPKQSILVVDDVPENIDLLSETLVDDYRVRVTTSGEKALQIVYSDEPPDLILLDIMMPGLSGLEICRRLKANPDRRRIPIIFVTAMSTAADEERGLAIGAVDYITKPISPPIVKARVRTHLALYDQARELERMVHQRTAELLTTRQQIIRRLGRAAEFKDNETGNHVLRMSHYVRLIAEAYGLGQEATDIIANTAPMHDIGKIGIPDAILLKPGPLDTEEWRVMRQHPLMGAKIIGKHENELLETARVIALNHHEKWNGSGYPRGLKGTDIPLEGRIVAIADVFDALVSVRPYKPAFPLDEALRILKHEDGRHFDPQLLQAFHKALPDILRIRDIYADENGALTDLEFRLQEIYDHREIPEGHLGGLTHPKLDN
ncbi:two-component system response regulator [Azonexus sp.]|jgi:putative two-component system response regulator|uniref:two-component system response regulator n=1 Tax=Azonexus sp. TaxID=1872668 RepID=UPI00281A694B|nr:two-component system response regulator [Azonexus sp.]MDR1995646.1 two-component system response regulator [Azonexus sp.]